MKKQLVVRLNGNILVTTDSTNYPEGTVGVIEEYMYSGEEGITSAIVYMPFLSRIETFYLHHLEVLGYTSDPLTDERLREFDES